MDWGGAPTKPERFLWTSPHKQWLGVIRMKTSDKTTDHSEAVDSLSTLRGQHLGKGIRAHTAGGFEGQE